jgi:hypothetical protein
MTSSLADYFPFPHFCSIRTLAAGAWRWRKKLVLTPLPVSLALPQVAALLLPAAEKSGVREALDAWLPVIFPRTFIHADGSVLWALLTALCALWTAVMVTRGEGEPAHEVLVSAPFFAVALLFAHCLVAAFLPLIVRAMTMV